MAAGIAATKIAQALAVLLTLGQLNDPTHLKRTFDKEVDRTQVIQIMRGSCKSLVEKVRTEKGIELPIPIGTTDATTGKDGFEEFLFKMIEGAKANNASTMIAKDIDLEVVKDVYQQICKGKEVSESQTPIASAVEYYNDALKDLPEDAALIGLKTKVLNQSAHLYDLNGNYFSEIYESGGRRKVISTIPDLLKKAFVAIEDRRFFQHSGIDEVGLFRAFLKGMNSGGKRTQGASTITQQMIKNLVTGDEYTVKRKIREIILSTRLEKLGIMKKDEILNLYLNQVYQGRNSWGVEMAANSYFAKSAQQLSLSEMAFLAGITHKPNFYNFTKNEQSRTDRRNEVLNNMLELGFINVDQYNKAKSENLVIIKQEDVKDKSALYFTSDVRKHLLKSANIDIYSDSYKVYSTIHPQLQKATEAALQEGLWNYERANNIAKFEAPEGNIEKLVNPPAPTEPAAPKHVLGNLLTGAEEAKPQPLAPTTSVTVPWQSILPKISKPLADIQWDLAVVTKIENRRIIIGLRNGLELPLSTFISSLKQWDLIYVKLYKEKNGTTIADIRTRPKVQGAAVVIENASGRVLSMVGGFSYSASQVNRASLHSIPMRQIGSTIKPFVYLAALQKGFQPNTLLLNTPFTFPIKGSPWTPKNYSGKYSGPVTMRYALEHSLNVPTARWLNHLEDTPQKSFDTIRNVLQDVGVYNYEAIQNSPELAALYKNNSKGLRDYKQQYNSWSSVLGIAPARLLDLAAGYATISNGGLRPTIHLVDRVEKDGKTIFPNQPQTFSLSPTKTIERSTAYQLKTFLQGTLLRGTAISMKSLADYVGGKTGTTSDSRDALFAGFTNEITVVVWVGYDEEETLSSKSTGGGVAAPIFQKIVTQSWDIFKKKTPLSFSDSTTERLLVSYPTDYATGTLLDYNSRSSFKETYKVAAESLRRGQQDFYDTRNLIVTNDYALPQQQEQDLWNSPRTVEETIRPPLDIRPNYSQEKKPQRRRTESFDDYIESRPTRGSRNRSNEESIWDSGR